MTDEIKTALEQVEAERKEKELVQLKEMFRQLLTKIENKKQEKKRIDEELVILNKELDDMKAGRFDKIKERQKLSERAMQVSPVRISYFWEPFNIPHDWWHNTWTIVTSSGKKEIFY